MVSMKIVFLATLGLATAQPLVKRDGDSVVKNINAIQAKIVDMTKAMEGFTGLLSAPTLLAPQRALEGAIRKATTDLRNEPVPIPEAESRKVLDSIKAIMPDVDKQMEVVVAKKDLFGLVKTIVQGEITNVRATTKELEEELIKRAPDSMKQEAKDLEAKSQAAFDKALAAFK
ncbi:hypothetical protein PYCC9005_005103 [Savitreella phatthalungensis]